MCGREHLRAAGDLVHAREETTELRAQAVMIEQEGECCTCGRAGRRRFGMIRADAGEVDAGEVADRRFELGREQRVGGVDAWHEGQHARDPLTERPVVVGHDIQQRGLPLPHPIAPRNSSTLTPADFMFPIIVSESDSGSTIVSATATMSSSLTRSMCSMISSGVNCRPK